MTKFEYFSYNSGKMKEIELDENTIEKLKNRYAELDETTRAYLHCENENDFIIAMLSFNC